jgi:hypothetical protein
MGINFVCILSDTMDRKFGFLSMSFLCNPFCL